jgi:hypothetical protein
MFIGEGIERKTVKSPMSYVVIPSPIDVYRRGHRAKNNEISDELCSQAVVERMVSCC